MISRNALSSALVAICVAVTTLSGTDAFTTRSVQSRAAFATPTTAVNIDSTTALAQFGKKKATEDYSDIESRDLTRAEMEAINKNNENVMNRELQAMTGISVLFSIPILYLCWVAFFSD
eukprot:CAMPEP_0172297650 /NCGR_PEP_ID=MMETSP1058-20130122/587_1 /TAXON_ID=83371 /ORGANISM="Detonula confervacea, Strain CCMP 353" /LENGTH=118 /DNA_ID=CAMNT_0013006821 /DNA_START=97 /DNA_END=453 /DNA_ORIENTATION=+